jgi:mono/diheme cytochrome c family protein
MKLLARKKSRLLNGLTLLPVFFILALLLTACGGNGMEETTVPLATDIVDEQPTATEEMPVAVSFANDVLPILNSRCAQCHGGARTEARLDVLSYEALMAGSAKGSVVIAGDADASSLVRLVITGEMPKQGAKLTSDQVQLFADWVNQGALDN